MRAEGLLCAQCCAVTFTCMISRSPPKSYPDHRNFADAERGLRGVKPFAQSHATRHGRAGMVDQHHLTSWYDLLHCTVSPHWDLSWPKGLGVCKTSVQAREGRETRSQEVHAGSPRARQELRAPPLSTHPSHPWHLGSRQRGQPECLAHLS